MKQIESDMVFPEETASVSMEVLIMPQQWRQKLKPRSFVDCEMLPNRERKRLSRRHPVQKDEHETLSPNLAPVSNRSCFDFDSLWRPEVRATLKFARAIFKLIIFHQHSWATRLKIKQHFIVSTEHFSPSRSAFD